MYFLYHDVTFAVSCIKNEMHTPAPDAAFVFIKINYKVFYNRFKCANKSYKIVTVRHAVFFNFVVF